MKLRSKFLKWNAGLPVAMLNKETAIELGVKAQEMILIKTLSKHPKEMTAVLDIIDGEFGKKQILLSLEVKSKMNLKKGQIVDINIAPIPRSVDLIRKKLGKQVCAVSWPLIEDPETGTMPLEAFDTSTAHPTNKPEVGRLIVPPSPVASMCSPTDASYG